MDRVSASQAAAVIYPPLFSKCSIKKDPEARVSTSNSSTLLLYLTLFQVKSSEDMILALAGQFKQLSHEPEKFR